MVERPRASVYVVVVGGANTDIVGHPFASLVAHDSNPGSVQWSPGGVGRNIAENLARLGIETELVTAIGGDHGARELSEECIWAGVGLAHAIAVPDLPGSTYLAILDENGEMEVALNDMRALERITPEALGERREVFENAALVVVDANLSVESLLWVAEVASAPLVLDPVSVAKAPRARGILPRVAALKCNAAEAAGLLGTPEPVSEAQVAYAAEKLLEAGVQWAFITAGTSGVHYASADERGWLAPPTNDVANATGAGDAFSAGVAASMLEGMGIEECARFGSALAGLALASERTVSEHVSRTAVLEAMEELGT